MNTLAIDIGGTKISAALISRNNQLTQHRQIATPASPSPTQLYEALVSIITPLKTMPIVLPLHQQGSFVMAF